jgi:hypothetical protein
MFRGFVFKESLLALDIVVFRFISIEYTRLEDFGP